MALAITQVYYRVLSGQGYECWGGRLKRLSVVSNPDTDTGYHLDYTSGPDFETSWAWTVITSLHMNAALLSLSLPPCLSGRKSWTDRDRLSEAVTRSTFCLEDIASLFLFIGLLTHSSYYQPRNMSLLLRLVAQSPQPWSLRAFSLSPWTHPWTRPTLCDGPCLSTLLF